MKLIVQIPCLNEEQTIGQVVSEIPRSVPGFSEVRVLIIDDGSTDGTVEAARRAGADHIVHHARRRGLARAFMTGIDASLRLGADVIVNTDADNQYRASEIPRLVEPIVSGKADFVVGDRQIESVSSFSRSKKLLQQFGSFVVRRVSHTTVPDTTSGFRAVSRAVAMRIFVHDDYTYTLETLVQAGADKIAVSHVAIATNPPTRASRLIPSIPSYVRRSAGTLLRVYTMYRPLRAFAYVGLAFLLVGVALSARFLVHYIIEPDRSRHMQSLLFAAACIIVAFQVFLFGFVADLIAANRRLLEDVRERLRRTEIEMSQLREREGPR